VGERIAAMDRASAVAACTTRLSHPSYDPYYPQFSSLPPLPTPHQTTPVANKNFPETLFEVVSAQEHAHIISWLPHGQGFIIHDKQRFASIILPRYFDGAKFTSFTRRLKRWNFVRVPRGPELGAYYNKNFMRGRLEMVQKMMYQMKDQFDEAKKNGGDKNKEKDHLEEQIEKEAKSKVQSKLSEVGAQANTPSSCETQAVPAKVPSPELKTTHFINTQERPMSLPSTLPKTKAAVMSTSPRSHLASNSVPSSSPRAHPPNLIWTNDHSERRLMEMQRELQQRELLLSRSMMAHEVAPGRARLMPESTALRSFVGGGGAPNHSCFANTSAAQRMLNVERAEYMLEADLARKKHRNSISNNCPTQEMISSQILGSPKTHQEMMSATAIRDMKSRLAPQLAQSHERPPPPQRGSHGSPAVLGRRGESFTNGRRMRGEVRRGVSGGGRAVMMSREEEEEFTRYLIEKRRAQVGASVT